MNCPKCFGIFKEFRHNSTGIVFDVCEGCKGIWFDRNEFWESLNNKQVKRAFWEKGLVDGEDTGHSCPRCQNGSKRLKSGKLPHSELDIEHCESCKGFYFDKGEYAKSKKTIDESGIRLQSFSGSENISETKESDFSSQIFRHNLTELNHSAYATISSIEQPDRLTSFASFFSRIGSSASLILKEPEILLFCLLQALSVCIAYLLWVQMLDWIPPEVWKSAENSKHGSVADYVLIAWSFVCVGVAAFPIGLFSACTGVVHILDSQGKESTVGRCLKLVFPKIWPLWIFSWIDGWMTVTQILERLPKKNDKRSSEEKALSEAMYYAWKVGTIGIIPSLITTENVKQACANSLGLLKHKSLDILLLRGGYSTINWVVGVLAYGGAIYVAGTMGLAKSEIHSHIYEFYFYMAFPIFVAVGIIHLFVRPFYILALFDIYLNYMIETNRQIKAPNKNKVAQGALWFLSLLIIFIIVVFLFRNELGITKMLSTPYGESYKPD